MSDNSNIEKADVRVIIDVDDITPEQIEASIYTIRGKQVMLDSDLAILFQIETKRLNESVKRNVDRFPEDFCFQLDKDEYANLRSQIATSSLASNYGGRRYHPWVFTEHGVAMLATILKSRVATEVSVRIIRSFVEMRKFINSNALLLEKVTKLEFRQLEDQRHNEERFDRVFDYIEKKEKPIQKIFYEGQIYDALSLLTELISQATSKIVLIDNYVSVDTLDLLSKKADGVEVVIYTNPRTSLTEADVRAFNKQYPQLQVKHTERFHDRFLILDDSISYHIGASLKDAGKHGFAITKFNDSCRTKELLDSLNR